MKVKGVRHADTNVRMISLRPGVVLGVLLGGIIGAAVTFSPGRLSLGLAGAFVARTGARMFDLPALWMWLAVPVNATVYGLIGGAVGSVLGHKMRGSRRARVLSGLGLVTSLLVVIVFGISLKWGLSCVSARSISFSEGWPLSGLGISNGAIVLLYSPPAPKSACHWGGNFGARFWPWWLTSPALTFEGPVGGLAIPLWIPFLLTAVPSVIVWRRSRPFRVGHCSKCDYDLTGNVSGACPECGKAVEPAPKR